MSFSLFLDSKRNGLSAPALEDSGEDHLAGKYVPNSRSPSGRPHPVPLARLCAVVLSTYVLTALHLDSGCRDRSTYTTLSRSDWPVTRDQHAAMEQTLPYQAQRTRWRLVGRRVGDSG